MTAAIIDDPELRNKFPVYRDRNDAGRRLARILEKHCGAEAMVLAIPAGGVPVGLEVADHLHLPFDLLIIRKIPIPGYSEAGLGAVSLEGDLIINHSLVRTLGLSEEEIEVLAKPVRNDLMNRNRIFRGNRPWPMLQGRTVIIVDDGLASGYTMIAAARLVARKRPAKIVVAVPTASVDSVRLLAEEVDLVVCPNIRGGYGFAVALAYRDWHDLSPEEVVNLLRGHGSGPGS